MGTEKRERQKAGRQARLDQARAVEARKRRFKLVRNAVILTVVVVAVLLLLSRDDGGDDEVATESTSTTIAEDTSLFTFGEGPCPPEDGSAERQIDFASAPQDCLEPGATYTAVFETTAGTVRVALDTENTPGSANNFIALARYHYYDNTEIFRADTSIGILQGGSPHTQSATDPGPGYTIPDEGFPDDVAVAGAGGPFSYSPGDLVYARPGGVADSSSAQFFFCVTEACANLDGQGIYVKFGTVTEGLDVLEAILASAPDGNGAPSEAVTVTSVVIEQA